MHEPLHDLDGWSGRPCGLWPLVEDLPRRKARAWTRASSSWRMSMATPRLILFSSGRRRARGTFRSPAAAPSGRHSCGATAPAHARQPSRWQTSSGDGKADAGVYVATNGNWYVRASTGCGSAPSSFHPWSAGHGLNSEKRLVGLATADNKADVGYFFTGPGIRDFGSSSAAVSTRPPAGRPASAWDPRTSSLATLLATAWLT